MRSDYWVGEKKKKQTPKRSTFLYPHLYRARRLRKRNLPADVCLGKARGSFEVRKGHGPGLMSGERPEVDRIRSEFRGFALCHEVLESGSGIRAVVTVSLRNGAQKSLGGLDARRARPGPEQAAVSQHPSRDPLRPPNVRHRAWKWTLAVVCSAAVPGDTGPCAPLPRFHVLRWTSKRPGSGEGRTARLRRSLQRSDEVSPR